MKHQVFNAKKWETKRTTITRIFLSSFKKEKKRREGVNNFFPAQQQLLTVLRAKVVGYKIRFKHKIASVATRT